jgi:hypothetical protein
MKTVFSESNETHSAATINVVDELSGNCRFLSTTLHSDFVRDAAEHWREEQEEKIKKDQSINQLNISNKVV